MPRRLTYIECDCGKRMELKTDGTVDGAEVSKWQLDNVARVMDTLILLRYSRNFTCRNCSTTLKRQRTTREVNVKLPNEDCAVEDVDE